MMDPTERGNIRRYVKMMLFRICEHFFSDADREANWMTARGLSDAFEKEFPFTEITITEGDTKLKLPPKVYVSVGNKHWTWCIASRIPEAGDMIYYDSFREVVWNIIKITDRNAALIDARKTVKGEGKVMEQHQANQLIKEFQKLNKTLTAIEKDIRAMRPREEPPVNVNHERDILVSIGILFGRGEEKDEALYAIYMNSFCTLFPNVMLVEEPEDEFLFPKAGKILAARVDDKSFFIATEKDGPDLPGIEDLLGYLRVRNVR